MFSKKLLNLISIILFCNSLFSQVSSIVDIEEKYLAYFELDKETFYTHLNKQIFLTTENLWFKSYVYNNKEQEPYLATTNVYLTIYDSSGKLVERKLYYAKNGITFGNFSLKDYSPGIYFLKVSTTWMKNFNEPDYSLTEFKIINNNESAPAYSPNRLDYDIQFLPEGGHAISEVVNSFGFKVINSNGVGEEILSGEIVDKGNQMHLNFKSNSFGMGKFQLKMEPNKTYYSKIVLKNGTEITKELPKPDEKGLTILINSLNSSNLLLVLQTNKATLPQLLDKSYWLLIHRDGLFRKMEIKFKPETLNYNFQIPRNSLFSGINIITVFNEKNEPVLERSIYNPDHNLINEIKLEGVLKQKDSIEIFLKATQKDSVLFNVSISALPSSTLSYKNNNDIISTFLLQPYISGNIENPSYYFKDNSFKTLYDLDLLLLNQGWSRYSWNNIFYSPQKPYFNFEIGFQIKGKLNGSSSDYEDIILISKENGLFESSPLDSENYFNFENLFLADTTDINFGATNKKGLVSKPNAYYNLYPIYSEDSIIPPKTNLFDQKYGSYPIAEFLTYEKVTILDTVNITGKNTYKPKNRIFRGQFGGRYIDLESRYSSFNLVLDAIRDSGFNVNQSGLDIRITSNRTIGMGAYSSPIVYVDNVQLDPANFNFLYNLTIGDIEELYISKIPSMVGGLGGSINIFTKKGNGGRKTIDTFASSKLKFGFSLPEKYSPPFYNTSMEETFSNYGVLGWFPEIIPNEDGLLSIKVPNYEHENINLYIQGMGTDGSLISKVETIPTNY